MEKELYPNCSEFCIRIKEDDLNEQQRKKLDLFLEVFEEISYEGKEFTESEKKKALKLINTYGPYDTKFKSFEQFKEEGWTPEIMHNSDTIFGIKARTIKGESGDHGGFIFDFLDAIGVKSYESETY